MPPKIEESKTIRIKSGSFGRCMDVEVIRRRTSEETSRTQAIERARKAAAFRFGKRDALSEL